MNSNYLFLLVCFLFIPCLFCLQNSFIPSKRIFLGICMHITDFLGSNLALSYNVLLLFLPFIQVELLDRRLAYLLPLNGVFKCILISVQYYWLLDTYFSLFPPIGSFQLLGVFVLEWVLGLLENLLMVLIALTRQLQILNLQPKGLEFFIH